MRLCHRRAGLIGRNCHVPVRRVAVDPRRGAVAERRASPAVERFVAGYAIGSLLRNGRLSQLLPAATMQLRPAGVVLTTVQVPLFSEA